MHMGVGCCCCSKVLRELSGCDYCAPVSGVIGVSVVGLVYHVLYFISY